VFAEVKDFPTKLYLFSFQITSNIYAAAEQDPIYSSENCTYLSAEDDEVAVGRLCPLAPSAFPSRWRAGEV
jgi:hypothetical protein